MRPVFLPVKSIMVRPILLVTSIMPDSPNSAYSKKIAIVAIQILGDTKLAMIRIAGMIVMVIPVANNRMYFLPIKALMRSSRLKMILPPAAKVTNKTAARLVLIKYKPILKKLASVNVVNIRLSGPIANSPQIRQLQVPESHCPQ